MNDDIDAKYTAICSAQTIYSDDKGFFGELFDSVKAECTDQWIEQMFSSSMNDIDKLKVLYNEPNVSDVLLGTLEHVAPIFTKKDEPFSRQRCKASEQLMATKDFDKAVLVLSQAVLRAPHKGSGRGKERKRERERGNERVKTTSAECFSCDMCGTELTWMEAMNRRISQGKVRKNFFAVNLDWQANVLINKCTHPLGDENRSEIGQPEEFAFSSIASAWRICRTQWRSTNPTWSLHFNEEILATTFAVNSAPAPLTLTYLLASLISCYLLTSVCFSIRLVCAT